MAFEFGRSHFFIYLLQSVLKERGIPSMPINLGGRAFYPRGILLRRERPIMVSWGERVVVRVLDNIVGHYSVGYKTEYSWYYHQGNHYYHIEHPLVFIMNKKMGTPRTTHIAAQPTTFITFFLVLERGESLLQGLGLVGVIGWMLLGMASCPSHPLATHRATVRATVLLRVLGGVQRTFNTIVRHAAAASLFIKSFFCPILSGLS